MTTTSTAPTFEIDRGSDGQATLWLEAPHQPVVVFDRTMLARLDASLDALMSDPPSCLIIRSRDERVWVAGADLKEIDGLSDESLEAYLAEGQRVFGRLASSPFTVIAAIHGATLGGGLELALHCHGIVASIASKRGKPYPIGLPEASLGLIPAWGGTQLLPARVAPETSVPAIAHGRTFLSDSMPDGLIDLVVENPEQLDDACRSVADSLDITELPRTIASCDHEESILSAVEHIRHDAPLEDAADVAINCISIGIKNGMDAGLDMEREGLVSLRNTPHTRSLLHAFLSRNN